MEINYNNGNDMKYFSEDQKKELFKDMKSNPHQVNQKSPVTESNNEKSSGSIEYITE